MEELEGRTAVITGAASGLGLAFAKRFATAGMNIVLADVEEPALAGAVAEVGALVAERGNEAIGVLTDVSDEAAVQSLAEQAIARFERVNVVCNNAGVAGNGLVSGPGKISTADWKWVLDVNLWGVIHGHQAFLPHLLDHGDGHIVNTASMAGHFPGHSAYSASKWAVVGISEGLFNQLRAIGSPVGVSCLCPGWINTRIGESDRNRPEWAAPDALNEPSAEAEERYALILEELAAGKSPDFVADLVHDAVVGGSFWIFTHSEMVASLKERFDAILEDRNPHWQPGLLDRDD